MRSYHLIPWAFFALLLFSFPALAENATPSLSIATESVKSLEASPSEVFTETVEEGPKVDVIYTGFTKGFAQSCVQIKEIIPL
ncbi:MAG TPA: hypothetical protein V6C82_10170, partial [Chroococcales cyanobacterium]